MVAALLAAWAAAWGHSSSPFPRRQETAQTAASTDRDPPWRRRSGSSPRAPPREPADSSKNGTASGNNPWRFIPLSTFRWMRASSRPVEAEDHPGHLVADHSEFDAAPGHLSHWSRSKSGPMTRIRRSKPASLRATASSAVATAPRRRRLDGRSSALQHPVSVAVGLHRGEEAGARLSLPGGTGRWRMAPRSTVIRLRGEGIMAGRGSGGLECRRGDGAEDDCRLLAGIV